jgi:hypothetical protein
VACFNWLVPFRPDLQLQPLDFKWIGRSRTEENDLGFHKIGATGSGSDGWDQIPHLVFRWCHRKWHGGDALVLSSDCKVVDENRLNKASLGA